MPTTPSTEVTVPSLLRPTFLASTRVWFRILTLNIGQFSALEADAIRRTKLSLYKAGPKGKRFESGNFTSRHGTLNSSGSAPLCNSSSETNLIFIHCKSLWKLRNRWCLGASCQRLLFTSFNYIILIQVLSCNLLIHLLIDQLKTIYLRIN